MYKSRVGGSCFECIFDFLRNWFFKVLYYFTFPSTIYESFSYSTSLTTFDIFSHLNLATLTVILIWISICLFYLHLSSLVKYLFKIFAHLNCLFLPIKKFLFVFLFLSSKCSSFFFNKSILLYICFANIFSQTGSAFPFSYKYLL